MEEAWRLETHSTYKEGIVSLGTVKKLRNPPRERGKSPKNYIRLHCWERGWGTPKHDIRLQVGMGGGEVKLVQQWDRQ